MPPVYSGFDVQPEILVPAVPDASLPPPSAVLEEIAVEPVAGKKRGRGNAS